MFGRHRAPFSRSFIIRAGGRRTASPARRHRVIMHVINSGVARAKYRLARFPTVTEVEPGARCRRPVRPRPFPRDTGRPAATSGVADLPSPRSAPVAAVKPRSRRTHYATSRRCVQECSGAGTRWNAVPANIVGHRWNANTDAFRQITSYSLG